MAEKGRKTFSSDAGREKKSAGSKEFRRPSKKEHDGEMPTHNHGGRGKKDCR